MKKDSLMEIGIWLVSSLLGMIGVAYGVLLVFQ